MFSPTIISERVAGMLKNYDFITKETLAYFDKRLTQAPRDADFALDYVKTHATTPELQRQAMAALSERNSATGRAPLNYGIGVHVGDVMYGNIGAPDRLDFTVIGPAVNLVSRIEGLCA